MKDWHLIPEAEVSWLVDGLFPADGYSAVCGKPKAGKSSAIRNLIASVIKSRPFLGRCVNVPNGEGRVLYIHLDRKDRPAAVVKQLKQLGITSDDEVSRLHFMVEKDLPSDSSDVYQGRLDWLKEQVKAINPHLIVIDLLWHFVCASNTNDYRATLDGINKLQDALEEANYKGALVVALHGRKSTNIDQPFDDVLGSTGQRGSFSTLVMLTQYKAEKRYTIMSDQTEREHPWDELDETVIHRNPDGTLFLGQSCLDLKNANKLAERENDIHRLLAFIKDNPGVETADIVDALGMSKAHLLKLAGTLGEFIERTGKGIKGDPYKYFLKPSGINGEDEIQSNRIPAAQEAAEEIIRAYSTIN